MCGLMTPSRVECRAAPVIKQDESPHQFQERVRQEGPSKFQAAMREVHAVLEGTSSWPNWNAAQQKSCMRVRLTTSPRLATRISSRCHAIAETWDVKEARETQEQMQEWQATVQSVSP